MISYVYKRCGRILAGKPMMLWGLSLLCGLLTTLATIFGQLPIITLPIKLTLEAGMVMIYLDGYKGKNVNSDQLFKGFKNFGHVAGGMAWRYLWTLIWGSISLVSGLIMIFAIIGLAGVSVASILPSILGSMGMGGIGGMGGYSDYGYSDYGYSDYGSSYSSGSAAGSIAVIGILCFLLGIVAIIGLVIVIMKKYSYRFTPYILMEHPEISATEALRLSMRQTKGHKGTLFLADFLCGLAMFVVYIVYAILSAIPFIGGFFRIVLGIVLILVWIVLPLFKGLYQAGLYIEITNGPTPAPAAAMPNTPVQPVTPSAQPTVAPAQPSVEPVQTMAAPVTEAPIAPQPEAPASAPFCTQCGNPLKPGQKFCTKCGKPVA